MIEPELGEPEVSRILKLDRQVWHHLINIGVNQGPIPDKLAYELPHGLDEDEVELVRIRVEENVTAQLPAGDDSERIARKIGRNALVALGKSAVENGDFLTSGSVVKNLDPGQKIWKARSLIAKLYLQRQQAKAMKVL